MAKKRLEDLRTRTADEMSASVIGLKKELMEMRFAAVAGEVKDTDRKGRLRRQIAVLKTLIKEKAAQPKKETVKKKAVEKTAKSKE